MFVDIGVAEYLAQVLGFAVGMVAGYGQEGPGVEKDAFRRVVVEQVDLDAQVDEEGSEGVAVGWEVASADLSVVGEAVAQVGDTAVGEVISG